MATKTITITEEAYQILKSWKESNDSFSDVIKKIGKKTDLSKLATILNDKESEFMAKEFKKQRKNTKYRYTNI